MFSISPPLIPGTNPIFQPSLGLGISREALGGSLDSQAQRCSDRNRRGTTHVHVPDSRPALLHRPSPKFSACTRAPEAGACASTRMQKLQACAVFWRILRVGHDLSRNMWIEHACVSARKSCPHIKSMRAIPTPLFTAPRMS